MVRKAKASQLYREGRFNYADHVVEPDGSVTIRCSGVKAPRPFTFRARNFLAEREEILEDQEVELNGD